MFYHSSHSPQGIVIAAGGPFRRKAWLVEEGLRAKDMPEDRQHPSVHDVTPTVLGAMGLPIPLDLDGRPMEVLFEEAFLREPGFRLRRLGLEWAPMEEPGAASKGEEDEALETLRALGYAK